MTLTMRIDLLFGLWIPLLLSPLLLSPAAMARVLHPTETPPAPWRVLGQDEAHSASQCLGKTMTPLCAVETNLASYLWHRMDYLLLSSTIYSDAPKELEAMKNHFLHSPRFSDKLIWYKITENRPLTPAEAEDAPSPTGVGFKSIQIDNGWIISIAAVDFSLKDSVCSTRRASGDSYWLHQKNGQWVVVAHREDIRRGAVAGITVKTLKAAQKKIPHLAGKTLATLTSKDIVVTYKWYFDDAFSKVGGSSFISNIGNVRIGAAIFDTAFRWGAVSAAQMTGTALDDLRNNTKNPEERAKLGLGPVNAN